jgi:hypothetical protein
MVEPRLPNAPQLPPLAELAKPFVERAPQPEATPAPPPDLHQAVSAADPPSAKPAAADLAPEVNVTPADRIEPQPSANAEEHSTAPAQQPPPPPEDDAPGAFMDVLSRADAEAQAAEQKRKPS